MTAQVDHISSIAAMAAAIFASDHDVDAQDYIGQAYLLIVDRARRRGTAIKPNMRFATRTRIAREIACLLTNEDTMEAVDEPSLTLPPPSPFSLALQAEMRQRLTALLCTLNEREERTLRMRFGILPDRDASLLEDVAHDLSVTKQQARQLEVVAMRKLKHPMRSRMLRSYVAGADDPAAQLPLQPFFCSRPAAPVAAPTEVLTPRVPEGPRLASAEAVPSSEALRTVSRVAAVFGSLLAGPSRAPASGGAAPVIYRHDHEIEAIKAAWEGPLKRHPGLTVELQGTTGSPFVCYRINGSYGTFRTTDLDSPPLLSDDFLPFDEIMAIMPDLSADMDRFEAAWRIARKPVTVDLPF
ncbi:sigma factor-like helix-turn-helix DNA-binding protein [Sphingosinicella sp. BN140058]|uniref:sigma factor-like helix-turn-helix DNA-binding protein n=1 Tax=Sphingosinicella sp. BN140058 TaxID=1892855 RepID=UPI001010874B|nr:sigma factor-like helix-turn-helix DNA-binding protein [Sphingosinicella sp. BN140058]QAY80298.1 hypothetical protein ETR14_27020 [Sphingosinicella sp. BN140058]